jgi:hypothetical protein
MPSEIDAEKIRSAKALEAHEKARREEALKAKAEKDQLPEQATAAAALLARYGISLLEAAQIIAAVFEVKRAADKDAKQKPEIVDIEAADLEAGAESEPDNFIEPPAAPESIGNPG